MKVKNILIGTAVVALACAMATRVYANAGIEVVAEGSTYLGLSDQATWLPSGDLILVGSFLGGSYNNNNGLISALVSGGQISQANYTALLGNFVPLNGTASGVVGSGASGYDGAFDLTAVNGGNSSFAQTPIYVMAFNASTTAAATEVGVYTFPASGSSEYPSSMATGSANANFDMATELIGTSVSGLTNPYDTDQNFAGNNNDVMLSLENIQQVPEPSTVTLVVLGMLGAIGLIRRRR